MGSSDKRARQRANREARRAREAKEARRRQILSFARRAGIALLVVLVAGIVISRVFGSDDEPEATTVPPTTTAATDPTATTLEATTTTLDPELAGLSPEYAGYRQQPTACGAEPPPPVTPMEFEAPGDEGLAPDATVTATVVTSCGDLVIELDPGQAPDTVNSFVFLARQDYFDGIVSHRIVPGFVVQVGDPTATGRGGPGYTIADDFPDPGFAYDRGVVAMAKAGPDSTGSQWFIAFTETGLSPEFNPLGRLVEGFDVLDRIEGIPQEAQRPLESLYIEDVVIEVG